MKLTKKETQDKIEMFFKKEEFTQQEMKKIKKLALKFNIKLGAYKKNYCKKCHNKLEGKIKVNKTFKTVSCSSCGFLNKIKLR